MARAVKPTRGAIARAAKALIRGRLIGLPTETVYGLAGDATNAAAISRIYAAKGRPRFNPLIVHVCDLAAARRLARFNPQALMLARAFWPGPLTLVLPRRVQAVARRVAAGRDTLAIRLPGHPVARAILRAAARPIAAPSANPSGRISATRARDVSAALRKYVAMVVDAGAAPVGLESTVVDLSRKPARLLRAGAITRAAIEALLGPIETAGDEGKARLAPGRMESHYAPARPVRLDAREASADEAYLGFGGTRGATLDLSPAGDLAEAGRNLFAALRSLDRPPFSAIAVAPIPRDGLGEAINDRLRRAAAPRAPRTR